MVWPRTDTQKPVHQISIGKCANCLLMLCWMLTLNRE